MKDTLEIVRHFSKLVDNGRTQQSISRHMRGEVDELDDEIKKAERGEEPGPDGIVGENIDIIACALDSILKADPNITYERICELMHLKCTKWAQKYG